MGCLLSVFFQSENFRVPGMGTIQGFLQSIHAREILCRSGSFFFRQIAEQERSLLASKLSGLN